MLNPRDPSLRLNPHDTSLRAGAPREPWRRRARRPGRGARTERAAAGIAPGSPAAAGLPPAGQPGSRAHRPGSGRAQRAIRNTINRPT